MKLFVDDLRDAPDTSWAVARTYDDAVRVLSAGGVEILSLDNDLSAYDRDGRDIANWMVENLARWPRTIHIHTANVLARDEIEQILRSANRPVHIVHNYEFTGLEPEDLEDILISGDESFE